MNFRKLKVYPAAIRFLPLAARMADSLPPRKAGMADQLRRTALSIPLHIAEGSGKNTGPDQRRYYAIAAAAQWNARRSLMLVLLSPSLSQNRCNRQISCCYPA
jgi:four helix bundle protein